MISDTADVPYSVFVSGPRAPGFTVPAPLTPISVAAASLGVASLLMEQLLDHSPAVVTHSLRVARHAARVASRLPGDPWRGRESEVYAAALVHDVGKINEPLDILLAARPLTAIEYACIKDHPFHGVALVRQYAAVSPLLEEAAWGHHEWWDGSGYPRHLAGAEIPAIARLVSLVDAFDAMCEDRPYRRGLTAAVALAEVSRGAGTQFEPGLVAWVLAHGLLSDSDAGSSHG